ncbi:MAG: hypothetical protein HKO65_18865 [Gemmatimonadetes bacterium]|nr:hypothetical protein [Gemmatimonadota bacterium]NNM07161.1 hypothetical protein [Gemmatimonadota bacterium]
MSANSARRGRDKIKALSLALLGSFLIFSGCSTGGSSENPFNQSTARDQWVLRVESRNSYETQLFIDLDGRRELLATLQPRTIQFVEFQYPLGRPLRLEVESFIGDRYRIPPGASIGGGRVDLIIFENIRRTTFVRR